MIRPSQGTYAFYAYVDANAGNFGAFAGGVDNPTVILGGFGQIDEFRVSTIGRVSAGNATVPTAAFTKDASTLLLAHLDGDGVIS